MSSNLLSYNDTPFRAKIKGTECVGRIRVECGRVYLCQNIKDGSSCNDKLGYRYSWAVLDGSDKYLRSNRVTDFELLITDSLLDNFRDFHEGDMVSKDSICMEVVLRSGKLVICVEPDGGKVKNYTCDQLYNDGWRLKVKSYEGRL